MGGGGGGCVGGGGGGGGGGGVGGVWVGGGCFITHLTLALQLTISISIKTLHVFDHSAMLYIHYFDE